MNNFLGNEQLLNSLKNDVASRKLPHAIIIEGAKGSGKRTIARQIALMLNCQNSPSICLECSSCRKILTGQSPDVITTGVPEGKTQIGVEAVRFLRSDVYVRPNDNDYKIYIVESADKMTDEAQNAFLKVFEEPPAYAVFLLLCETADTLLTTIKSRARTLRTEIFSTEVLKEYLLSTSSVAKDLNDDNPDSFNLALVRACGAVGRALENIEPEAAEKNFEAYNYCYGFIKMLKNRASAFDILTYLQSKEHTRDSLTEFLSVTELLLRDILAYKLSYTTDFTCFTDEDEVSYFASSLTSTFLIDAVSIIENCKQSIVRNGNIQNIITAFSAEINTLRSKF